MEKISDADCDDDPQHSRRHPSPSLLTNGGFEHDRFSLGRIGAGVSERIFQVFDDLIVALVALLGVLVQRAVYDKRSRA